MTSNNSMYFIGAAVVGIVSAAGVFIAEHFRQERRRHAMAQDLARLDQQLSGMRKELEQLRQLQKEKLCFQYSVNLPRSVVNLVDGNTNRSLLPDLTYRLFIRNAQRLRKHKRPMSNRLALLSESGDDYTSAPEADSSDMEFYDLSDEEETVSTATSLEQTLKDIDDLLNGTKLAGIKEALDCLVDLLKDSPENPELLWRIGKSHHKISSATEDAVVIQQNIEKGLAACQTALDLNPNIAEAHKWYAILVGSRSKFQPVKEKISDGFLFKEHIDAALALNPTDATLHHMLGRFFYETASLKWYERKVATTFFTEPPSASYDEALEHFLEAEQLTKNEWKENKLMIAKAQIALGLYEEAMETLAKADSINNDSLDTTIDSEVKTLLQKYNSYR